MNIIVVEVVVVVVVVVVRTANDLPGSFSHRCVDVVLIGPCLCTCVNKYVVYACVCI